MKKEFYLSIRCNVCKHVKRLPSKGTSVHDTGSKIIVQWVCRSCRRHKLKFLGIYTHHQCLYTTKDNLDYMGFKGEPVYMFLKEQNRVSSSLGGRNDESSKRTQSVSKENCGLK